MKIATWNVNSFKVRLPQVLAWLEENPVDILCLQELKQDNPHFPIEAIEQAGYHACWSGQKTYNGVAILSRQEPQHVIKNNPLYEDSQQRLVASTFSTPQGDLRMICVYCPNGSSLDSDKYRYKLDWFKALNQFIQEELKQYPYLALAGDFNIAPTDEDVHAKYSGDILISPPERQAFSDLLALGLHDSFRLFKQEPKSFSWWDYRMMGFKRNAGMRIDHILISDPLKAYCHASYIDKVPRGNEQPSDHTPVVTELLWS